MATLQATELGFTAIKAELAAGNLTVRQLVEQYLTAISARPNLNVWLQVYADEALAQADLVDAKRAQGTAGALAGMVIGLKDNLCYKDHPVTAGSKILSGMKGKPFVSQFTAPAIQRLLDQDAIIIGRQNCDEFGMGSSNENSAFGPVLNGIDETRVPGGSSGGSAVAVQAGQCTVSLGSDTGGSVRQPAAFNGIVGLKPTYGRISRFGLIAYASSFDTIGIMARTAADVAEVLQYMAGPDGLDSTATERPADDYVAQVSQPVAKKRIAILRDGLESPAVAESTRQAVAATVAKLEAQGHTTGVVDFKMLDVLLPTYYILTTAEASSNLSRYDGIRYGHRSDQSTDLESLYKLTRAEGFGPEVKRRIMLGTFVLSANYYDAYFTKAQRVRRLIREETLQILADYDYVLMPVAADVAFKFGAKSTDPLAMFLSDVFTVQANVVGLPALAFPTGHTHDGMPIGLQLLGRSFDEAGLLQLVDGISN